MRAFILGNGESLKDTPFHLLKGERTFGVNYIWKWFDKTDWRPTDYVIGELPAYNVDNVKECISHMIQVGVRMHVQAGFKPFMERIKDAGHKRRIEPHPRTSINMFVTCHGDKEHDWHLPMVCGYGTVVNIAVQLAIAEGADEIFLLGCDLGTKHFHEGEFTNTNLATRAHEIAQRCSTVPIFNATIGGSLEVYPRVDIYEVLRGNA
jgi:hypothetical protein